jgi:hypothetical protein
MRIIAFINEAMAMREILAHLGEPDIAVAHGAAPRRCGSCPMPRKLPN